jgi:hypothetical protein
MEAPRRMPLRSFASSVTELLRECFLAAAASVSCGDTDCVTSLLLRYM